MIKREITTELIQAAKEYPIVTIIGPRQSGKTTLAKITFPKYDYCSLEDPDIRQFAINDPRSFLTDHSHNVIFDEIQRAPELLIPAYFVIYWILIQQKRLVGIH